MRKILKVLFWVWLNLFNLILSNSIPSICLDFIFLYGWERSIVNMEHISLTEVCKAWWICTPALYRTVLIFLSSGLWNACCSSERHFQALLRTPLPSVLQVFPYFSFCILILYADILKWLLFVCIGNTVNHLKLFFLIFFLTYTLP